MFLCRSKVSIKIKIFSENDKTPEGHCKTNDGSYCSCDKHFVRREIEKRFGQEYKPFFAYDFANASMEFPGGVPDKLKVDLYSLILGVINNDCPVPCKQ